MMTTPRFAREGQVYPWISRMFLQEHPQGHVKKFEARFNRGFPDLMLAHGGRCVFLEIKLLKKIPRGWDAEAKEFTPLQRHELQGLHAAGLKALGVGILSGDVLCWTLQPGRFDGVLRPGRMATGFSVQPRPVDQLFKMPFQL